MLSEIFTDADARLNGPDVDVSALAYDSRRVVPGALFAALGGVKHDGHTNVDDAVARGAVALLVAREVDCGGVTKVMAKDTRRALALAARRFFFDPAAQLTMVGITGTNGKTTTTHVCEALLEAAGKSCGVIGTLGARFGDARWETGLTTPESVDVVALCAEMLGAGCGAVAMEVSSHALDQWRVGGVAYDVGIFTNLTHDHLDYHGTLDAYFAAKQLLFARHMKPGGVQVLNYDDARVRSVATPSAITFSAAGAAGARLRVMAADLTATGTRLELVYDEARFVVESPLVGRFNVENTLAGVGAAVALGIDAPTIARGVAAIRPVPGRLERVSSGRQPLVVVDYAHTPDALEKALVAVREVTSGKLVVVFGCGGDRDPKKREPMGETAARLADRVVVTSDNPRTEDPALIAAAIRRGVEKVRGDFVVELDRARAIEMAVREARSGDTVLVAGKGHEDYQIVGTVKRPFDDRIEARAALAAHHKTGGGS